jgi:RNA recognition motif-containing protein
MNLYVGNLSSEVTEDDLRSTFEECGQISSVSIIKDKFSGTSRGFGFVEMSSKSEGTTAIDTLNGRELKGKSISVNEARPRADNNRSGGGSSSRGGQRNGGGMSSSRRRY